MRLHLYVRMQHPSDTVKRQKTEDLPQEIQPSGLVSILLRVLFPSDLESTQILVCYIVYSGVITVSLPEAEKIYPKATKTPPQVKVNIFRKLLKLVTV